MQPNSLTVEVPADGPCEPQESNKIPRRILHFSDGTIEEYSTDEEDGVEPEVVQQNVRELNTVDPKSLTWMPWFWYQTVVVGTKTLDVCDYLGESLANFFGITTPKYQFELDQFEKMKAEEEALQKEEDLEMGGWVSKSPEDGSEGGTGITEPPTAQRY